jgi:tetratricopeptide (TPR) repeat protein
MNRTWRIILLIILAGAFVVSIPELISSWNWNRRSLPILQAVMRADQAALKQGKENLDTFQGNDCRALWYLGIVSEALGDTAGRDRYRESALLCSPSYIQILSRVAPDDVQLADAAVRRYPENAEAWFWLGEALFADQPELAVHAYRQVLEFQPDHSDAGFRLGEAQAVLEP